jgi:hypothetical protein
MAENLATPFSMYPFEQASAVRALRIGLIVVVCGAGVGGCTSVAPRYSPALSGCGSVPANGRPCRRV